MKWVVILIVLFILYTIFDGSSYTKSNTFLTAEQTNAFLAADDDGFVKTLNPINLSARRATSNKDLLEKISKSGRDFSPEQMEAINKLSKKLPASTFALTDGTYEEGYPHTRKDVVFISKIPDLSTIIHEQLHIQHRYNPPDLVGMGYKLVGKRSDYPRARMNPDANNDVWLSPVTKKPMVAQFNSDRPVNLMDIDVPGEFEHPYEYLAYTTS
jgi:hypothetical protein